MKKNGKLYLGGHNAFTAGEQSGIDTIVKSVNWLLERTADYRAKITLKTTARRGGQGAGLGHRFEQLAEIIERSANPNRVAVCFDTCHVLAAGYDISTRDGTDVSWDYEQTWVDFERIIGIEKLAVIHLNDTQKGPGSTDVSWDKVDRHDHIGHGQIGDTNVPRCARAFRLIMQDKRFTRMCPSAERIPKILETPKGTGISGDDDNQMDKINLGLLRKFALKKK
jgi:deoxyribonuclease-4